MDKAKQVKEDLRQRLLQRIHAISPTAESIFAGLAGDRKWHVVKNFSTEAGYSEQLTELDILFMAAAYETEKKTIGIDHINRIPLLDVHGVPLIERRNHAILRALASFEKWVWTCVLSPVCISVFPVVAVVEMGVSTDTYPFCPAGPFLSPTPVTLTIGLYIERTHRLSMNLASIFCASQASTPSQMEVMWMAGVVVWLWNQRRMTSTATGWVPKNWERMIIFSWELDLTRIFQKPCSLSRTPLRCAQGIQWFRCGCCTQLRVEHSSANGLPTDFVGRESDYETQDLDTQMQSLLSVSISALSDT